MRQRLRRWGSLIGILLLFVTLAWAHSAVVPLSKAPDEYVHFLYSQFVVEHGRLPTNLLEREAAGYKSDQPPLYYGLMALLVGWVDTDTPPTLKMTWDSPRRRLADIILPRGMIVWTEDETPPYYGIVLAWFIGRWLSVGLSAVTVFLTYLITRKIFPHRHQLALGATATLALIPSYLFISGVLNDDNLTGMLMAFFLLLLVHIAQSKQTGSWALVLLGGIAGLAMTTKYSTLVVPLEIGLAFLIIGRQQGWSWSGWLQRVGLCLATVLLVSGWWFGFVSLYFNEIDELGWVWGVVKPIIAGDASDPTVARLSDFLLEEEGAVAEVTRAPFTAWLSTLFMRFWQVPVFGQPPLFPPLFTGLLLGAISVLAWVGLSHIWRSDKGQDRFWLALLMLHVAVFLLLPLIRYAVVR